MEKLKTGEKYLTVKLVGHSYVNVFPNKDKKKEDQPDYKADGVAVWVKYKKESVSSDKNSA